MYAEALFGNKNSPAIKKAEARGVDTAVRGILVSFMAILDVEEVRLMSRRFQVKTLLPQVRDSASNTCNTHRSNSQTILSIHDRQRKQNQGLP